MIMILMFFLCINYNLQECSEINMCRSDYNGINSELKLEAFIKKYESSKCTSAVPYLASSIMMKAQYTLNPVKKLSYFNSGKSKLESFIRKNQTSIDGRYVRIMIQGTIPKFLNYSSDIKNDINFVKTNISGSDIPEEIKKTMLKNINNLK